MKRLSPGSTIGILGNGQLGRMLAQAAIDLGLKTHFYAPEPNSPASDNATSETIGDYHDLTAARKFAEACDIVTYEFENVPAELAAALRECAPIHPSPVALGITQDRLHEKTFLVKAGAETTPFAQVDNQLELKQAVEKIGLPVVLKTRRLGYDGKGQNILRTKSDTEGAFESLGSVPCILEGFIDFTCEISVIVARNTYGQISCYDPAENIHRNHILSTSVVPARIDENLAQRANDIATHIVEALDYVGVAGIELFATQDGRILVNEFAPRVHNSGHWTIDACVTSQFEQHLRAICGWPLGDTRRHSDALMFNLIGEDVDAWPDLAARPNYRLHLYGKRQARPGRKMGHVTELRPLGSFPPEGAPSLPSTTPAETIEK